MKRILFALLLLVLVPFSALADIEEEMITVADKVFSGNGTPDMVEWETFTFQLMPEVEPLDIASMFAPESTVPEDQRRAAQTLFLKSQGLAQMVERSGKTVTRFLLDKGFTLAIHEHSNSPALIFFNGKDPTRRFDFLRREGQLKLARVTLRHPSERD